jgi:hypothetical protein
VKQLAVIIGAVALLATASFAHAESYAGFKGGVNQASFTGKDADQFPYSRTGFTGGAFLGFDSGKRLGFRADLLYTMKGATTGAEPASALADTFVTSLIKIDYFELGTLLVARFDLPKNFALRAFIGPVIGLWVNAEADNGPEDVDLGDVVEHWEFSGTIGAEFDMTAGPYVFLLEARYSQGSRLFKDVGLDGEPLDFKVSNSGIGVLAGMMVPF